MKKKKISEIAQVSSLNSGERLVSLSADMKTLSAAVKNAVNSNISLSSINGFTGDNAHEIFNPGISTAVITNGNALYGFPISTGILVNIQKSGKGDASTNQRNYQIAMNITNMYFRTGSGDGNNVIYSAWKKITMTDI